MPSCVYREHVPEDALLRSMPLTMRIRADTREIFPLLTRIKRRTKAVPVRISLSIVPTFSMGKTSRIYFPMKNSTCQATLHNIFTEILNQRDISTM
jgi:hypothetical protein